MSKNKLLVVFITNLLSKRENFPNTGLKMTYVLVLFGFYFQSEA